MTGPEPVPRQAITPREDTPMTDIGPSWADLQPLTEAEARRWVAARDGAPDLVTRWRYLNDPVYHARVEIWERAHDPEGGTHD